MLLLSGEPLLSRGKMRVWSMHPTNDIIHETGADFNSFFVKLQNMYFLLRTDGFYSKTHKEPFQFLVVFPLVKKQMVQMVLPRQVKGPPGDKKWDGQGRPIEEGIFYSFALTALIISTHSLAMALSDSCRFSRGARTPPMSGPPVRRRISLIMAYILPLPEHIL